MYALHEAVVCRRRADGTLPWHWNTGIIAPKLPPPAAACVRG
jgi:para-nitrobenzyl esterase